MKFVYYNLHKHKWSVKDLKTGKVNGDHRDVIILTSPHFKVSQAGRKRVLEEKRKNVHAGVRGYIEDTSFYIDDNFKTIKIYSNTYYLREITYNPYKYDSFVYKDTLEPIYFTNQVLMIDRRVFEIN